MLFFAHTGFTLTAYCVLETFTGRRDERRLDGLIDYRLVLVGALLPDLIDKPLGALFPDVLGYGRTIAHTLLFLMIVSGIGLLLWGRRRRPGGLVLAGGCLLHLSLDAMWQEPRVLFWPLFGLVFPRRDPEAWLGRWLHEALADPAIFLTEIAGFLLCCGFILACRGHLTDLVRAGRTS